MSAARTNPGSSPREGPVVSVVMRTRNRELLLARALEDVAAQTFPHWELIVLNDGGEASPVEEAVGSRRAALGGRTRVEHLHHPVGRDGVLQTGLELARGEFFSIHDDDDTWHPDFLARTVDSLMGNASDVAVAVPTDVVVEHLDGEALREISRSTMTAPLDRMSLTDLIVANRIPPIGMLLRTRAALDVGGFDETLSVLGDWDLVLRLASLGPIGYISGSALAQWRHRPDADGDLANSVIGAASLHGWTARELGDRAVRDHISRHGIGGLVFTHALLQDRLSPVESELAGLRAEVARLGDVVAEQNYLLLNRTEWLEARIHHHTQYHSPVATVARFLSRLVPGRSKTKGHRGAE